MKIKATAAAFLAAVFLASAGGSAVASAAQTASGGPRYWCNAAHRVQCVHAAGNSTQLNTPLRAAVPTQQGAGEKFELTLTQLSWRHSGLYQFRAAGTSNSCWGADASYSGQMEIKKCDRGATGANAFATEFGLSGGHWVSKRYTMHYGRDWVVTIKSNGTRLVLAPLDSAPSRQQDVASCRTRHQCMIGA